jgi:hypothetical protein
VGRTVTRAWVADAGAAPLRTTAACQVHRAHLPRSHVNHRHHVWPLGHGGPDVPANIVVVCPSGHSNIHELLGLLLKDGGKVPYAVERCYTRRERDVARLGFERIARGAL